MRSRRRAVRAEPLAWTSMAQFGFDRRSHGTMPGKLSFAAWACDLFLTDACVALRDLAGYEAWHLQQAWCAACGSADASLIGSTRCRSPLSPGSSAMPGINSWIISMIISAEEAWQNQRWQRLGGGSVALDAFCPAVGGARRREGAIVTPS